MQISFLIYLHACYLLQVSVGTLLAFTIVAISILILRYVPPDDVPVPPSLQGSAEFESLPLSSQASNSEAPHENITCKNETISQELQNSEEGENLIESAKRVDADLEDPLILKENGKHLFQFHKLHLFAFVHLFFFVLIKCLRISKCQITCLIKSL
jgi:hypothetical protein